ncbi:hypothetical protein PUNSTDRAFT_146379 [Punctularia strigosozonata HHB-11173 SS5]|uniref:RRM domain-containing protein n=1 Tax=Punctularia strigosozonata (strain HHB-11173) TaxID=741275 RepID=R7S305_PUNST|nr:uncharacterized protein PUNSTDRAFT_146379 [Punctularia strigosozonata HHB-11173 SS5]EIN04750.1 hypothetical protein PUNSTDRAFT_146379 [Punctularia strigosozonata HHB-11173 SS5]
MSSALGKRKEREDEDTTTANHGSTLFVSNLPYTATSTDLQTLFSDIAPVRSAFVVTEHGSGVSKGVGYVSFAIKEDAQGAYDKIAEEGIELDGRKLRVTWAEKKGKHDEFPKKRKNDDDAAESTTKPKLQRKQTPKAGPSLSKAPDPLAIRTVVVSGLPSGLDTKTLWKKVRKSAGAEKVDWPLKAADGSEDPAVAHVLFSTPAQAQDAVNKLHAHVYKGALLSATLKKRIQGLAKAKVKASASTKKAKDAPSPASRLIVRNLPFNVSEQDLRAVFLPCGPIYSVHIPTKRPETEDEDADANAGKKEPRQRGFAFVWMFSKKDAEKAIERCNGAKVRSGMAERMVRDKQRKKKEVREERKREVAEKRRLAKKVKENEEEGEDEGEEDGGEASAEDEEEEESATNERVIAVDWALSKGKWEEEKAKMEQEQEDVSDQEASSSNASSAEEEASSESEGSVSDAESAISDEEGDEDARSADGDDDAPQKPQLPATDVGTTLFVRNVPYEATEEEMRTLFRAFGPLRYARITIDPETGRCRGTGFACFWNKEDADKAIEQSELLKAETGLGSTPAKEKKNPFKLPSMLTPDPSAGLARNLVLHGRTLDVVRAVTRDEAGKLKEAGERAREKADKRNLYLLREGLILPNSPAAAGLAPAELEKRAAAHDARKRLLRTNPLLYVSRTRLSVRGLPTFVTDRTLKRMAIHAVRAFEAEVGEGVREPLSKEELFEPIHEDGEQKEGKKSKKGRHTAVKQAKVVLQTDRVDPITGKGRSKGYGFVEMHTHADALRVLRWANNNHELGALWREWWKAELEDLIKAEKGKKKAEGDDEARVKRMEEELERVREETGDGKVKAKGALIVEFSIENAQVVQRRAAKIKEAKTGEGARGRRESDDRARGRDAQRGDRSKSRDGGERSKARNGDGRKSREGAGSDKKACAGEAREDEKAERAKRKRSVDDAKPGNSDAKTDEDKPGRTLGSIIGRKRKKRKTGH